MVYKLETIDTVKKQSELIESMGGIDVTTMKLLDILLSEIHKYSKDNLPNNFELHVSKNKVYSMFEATDTSRQVRFRHHVGKLTGTLLHIRNEDKKRERLYPVIRFIELNDKKETYVFKFEEEVLLYLLDATPYIKFQLSEVIKLKSKYSIILFQWLMMNYQTYKKYGNYNMKNPTIKNDKIRKLTGTENKYKSVTNFRNRILMNSLKEINEKTSLKVEYTSRAKGNELIDVTFKIELNQSKIVDVEVIDERVKNNENIELTEKEKIAYLLEKYLEYNLTNNDEMIIDFWVELYDYESIESSIHYVYEIKNKGQAIHKVIAFVTDTLKQGNYKKG